MLLAETLTRFSLDLCKLIHSYLAFRVATPGAVPIQALEFATTRRHGIARHRRLMPAAYGIGSSPLDNTIWVPSQTMERVDVFSSEGRFLRFAGAEDEPTWGHVGSIAFAANGEAFIEDRSTNDPRIVVCQPDAKVTRCIRSPK